MWVLQEPSGKVAIVDPSEAEPVTARLKELGLTPSYILNTHHHWDHTGERRTALSTAHLVPTCSGCAVLLAATCLCVCHHLRMALPVPQVACIVLFAELHDDGGRTDVVDALES